VIGALVAGVLALAATAVGEPARTSDPGGPAVFEAARPRGDAGHAAHMDPSDPHHQNLPSPEEVMNHLRAKGWSESKLSSVPAAEVATAAAKIEQDVVCPCGCPRQSIYDCNCRTAAELRGRVLDELARLGVSAFDLTTEDGRAGASREILRVLASDAGGADPSGGGLTTVTWLFVIASLGILIVVVARRRRARSAAGDRDPSP
jgi:cytochrome c-type biogenesis protein CcmH/NrfF